jgi:hypothetical protein
VYKLSALSKPDRSWDHKVRLPKQTTKVTNPGVLQVRRFQAGNEFTGDAIYNSHQYPAGLELTLHQFKTALVLRAKGAV